MYTKIFPLGKRPSKGSFDDFYDTKKFDSLKKSYDANDFVMVDFVKDEKGVIYFEFHHVKNPDEKKYHQLNYQHFPAGVDVMDDTIACEIAVSMF